MTSTSTDARNAAVATITDMANGGYLRIYGAKRAMLAELRFDSPAFGTPVDGLAKANPLSPESEAPKTGKALRYTVVGSDGETIVWDGDVSERGKGGSLQLDSIDIQTGAEVSISSVHDSIPAT